MENSFEENNIPIYTIVCSSDGIIKSMDEKLNLLTGTEERTVEHMLELITSSDFSTIKDLVEQKQEAHFVHFAIKNTELYFNLWSHGGSYNTQLNEYSISVSVGRFPTVEEKILNQDPNAQKLHSLSQLTDTLVKSSTLSECVRASIICIKQLFQFNTVFFYDQTQKQFFPKDLSSDEQGDFRTMMYTMLSFPVSHLQDLLKNYNVGKDTTNPIYIDQPKDTEETPQSDMGFYAVKTNETNFGLFVIMTSTIPSPSRVNWLNMVCSILAQRLYSLQTLDRLRIKQKKELQLRRQLLSFFSHEIKTPLSFIIGTIEVLIEEKSEAEQELFLKTLQYSANNLQQLANRFLTYTKLENGKLQLVEEQFTLRKTIESVFYTFKSQLTKKNLEASLELSENIPQTVIGDETQLTQILYNLIDNAIKFTREGLIKVTVEAKEVSSQSATINFEIKDTGIGIPDHMLKNILSPFEKVREQTNSEFDGWGLGLAIVQQILLLHKSTLQVHSKQSVGSTFSFELTYKIKRE